MKTSKYILDTAREYAIYVCDQRALPSITDGLKSSQRKAIWIARNHKDKIKTISLAGEMISSGLYVHGDASASQTISLMAAKYCNNIAWFDGYGAFGTLLNPRNFGAPRYTYVKLSKAAREILMVDLEVIEMQPNYDGSTYEPKTFLPLVPTILLNGISGIAIGWSTEILPHKLEDIVKATIDVLEGKKISDLVPYYRHYDVEVEKKGNSYEIRGKIEKINSTTVKIKSIPPDTSIENVKENLNKLVDEGKIKSYDDLSTDKIDITVKMERKIIADLSEEDLLKMFGLITSKTERIIVIQPDGKTIKQYDNHYDLIKTFVEWRKNFIRKRFEYKIEKMKHENRMLDCFIKSYEENLPQKTKNCKSKKELIDYMKKNKNLKDYEEFFDYIASLPLYRWTKDEYDKARDKVEENLKTIEKYENIISKDENIMKVYKDELKNLLQKVAELERAVK